MRKPRSSEELARQLEQETDDEKLWTQEPTEIAARPTRTSVLSLRLPTAEFHAVLKAARSAGESVSEYVRQAIAIRQTLQSISSPTVNIAFTYPEMPEEKALSNDWRTYTSGNPQPKPHVQTFAHTPAR